jgi:hypothetical protein
MIAILSIVPAGLILVFFLFCYWKIFTKAGEPGWKVFIPLYNHYTLCSIANAVNLFFVTWLCKLCMAIAIAIFMISYSSYFVAFMTYGGLYGVNMVPVFGSIILCTLLSIASYVIDLIIQVKLAKAFGKGALFGLGLMFFPIIFIPILAFGKAMVDEEEEEEVEEVNQWAYLMSGDKKN